MTDSLPKRLFFFTSRAGLSALALSAALALTSPAAQEKEGPSAQPAPTPPAPAQPSKEESKERDIELIDGQILVAEVAAITVEGIRLTLSGIPLQLDWSLVRADRFLQERKALVNEADKAALESYLRWGKEAGLQDEAAWAEEKLEYHRKLSEPPPTPPKDPIDPALKPSPPSDRPDKDGEPPPDARTATLIFADDEIFAKALRAGLGEQRVELRDKGGDIAVEVGDFALQRVGGSDFFGADVWAEYRGTCRVTLKGKAGIYAEHRFDSGVQHSNSDGDDAKRMCRDVLSRAIILWAASRLPVKAGASGSEKPPEKKTPPDKPKSDK